jgi:hypothetical protein
MHEAVKLGLDKSSSLELPAFEPEEIDYWLNEAQLQLVKQKAFGNNFRGEGFEDSVKRIEDLTTLVVESSEITLFSHPFYPNVRYTLTSSVNNADAVYLFFISATAKYEETGTIINTLPVKQEEIINLIETDFNIPYIKNPFVYFYENKMGVIYDPYKPIDSVYIKYIKQPKKLVRTSPAGYETNVCELPEQVHPEIVALTVNILLENIESERQQNNLFQLSKKE